MIRRSRCTRWLPCISCAFLLLTSNARADPSVSRAFDCLIEPQQVIKLASSVVGVVSELHVDRGDVVTKGQFLGKLEDGVEQANLVLAEARARNDHSIKAVQARLEFLTKKHGRARELVAKDIVSRAAADEAAAEAKVSEAQLSEAELNLEIANLDVIRAKEVVKQRQLHSPVTGVVVERLLVPGEYRNEQSPILTLAQIDPLRVEVIVPISHYGRIRNGGLAKVQPEKPVGGEHTATVRVVDRVLDAASGTFGVRLELPNPELAIPAGLRCRIVFELEESAIPLSGPDR